MIELIVCDDNAMSLNQTREFLTDMMHQWNDEIEIMTYTDSDSLMKRICSENEQTDILLLDIDMPDISGLEVAEFIHDKTRRGGVVVLDGVEEMEIPVSRRRWKEVSASISEYWRDYL